MYPLIPVRRPLEKGAISYISQKKLRSAILVHVSVTEMLSLTMKQRAEIRLTWKY